MITLTDEERSRFAAWLRQEAKTNRYHAEQMEKVAVTPGWVSVLLKQQATAAEIIADRLDGSERERISG